MILVNVEALCFNFEIKMFTRIEKKNCSVNFSQTFIRRLQSIVASKLHTDEKKTTTNKQTGSPHEKGSGHRVLTSSLSTSVRLNDPEQHTHKFPVPDQAITSTRNNLSLAAALGDETDQRSETLV